MGIIGLMYFFLSDRYEFQTGRGSGNLPHIHVLISLEEDQDEEAIFNKISAMSTSFRHENPKFTLEKCLESGKMVFKS